MADKTIGFRIRMQRIRTMRTQQQMADALHISLNGYQKYEQGEREPPLAVLSKMCDIFDIPADIILGRYEVLQLLGVDVDEYL